jgi:NAD-dependent SIR2 family protein deacetylase
LIVLFTAVPRVVSLVVSTAKELYPGSFVPTAAHHLVKLLHDKGVLLRVR